MACCGKLNLSISPCTARTEYHRRRGLSSRNVFPHSSGNLKYKIKVPAGSWSGESYLLGVKTTTFLLYPHVAPSLYSHGEKERDLSCPFVFQ